jgi:hypothetical protein
MLVSVSAVLKFRSRDTVISNKQKTLLPLMINFVKRFIYVIS